MIVRLVEPTIRPWTSWSPGPTGSAPIRATPTTPAATPPPRAPTTDPVTGAPVELVWVKGSGGDLGTLTAGRAGRAAAGPAARAGRRLPGRGPRGRDGRRVRLLPARQGRRGAVDRHRDARAGRRAARRPPAPGLRHRARHGGRRGGADQGDLRRPGGLGAVAAARLPAGPGHRGGASRRTRRRSACILGGHGITAWGATSDECEANSLEIIRAAAGVPRPSAARPSRSAPVVPGYEPLPEAERHAEGGGDASRWSAGWPPPTGRRSATTPTATSCSTSCPARSSAPLAELGTSCPDHFLRTKVKPLVLDLPADGVAWRRPSPGCASCTPAYRDGLPRRTTSGTPTADSPPMRGADPAIVLVPGVGMFSFGANKQTARVAGEFYVNAINVMRGAESVSTLRADRRGGEVPHRVLGARGGQAAPDARSRSRSPPGSRWSPAPARGSAGPSRTGSPPRAPASWSPTWTRTRPPRSPPRSAAPTRRSAVGADVSDEDAVAAALRRGRAGVRRGRPGGQQRRAVDLQAAAGDHRRATGTCSTT